MYKGQKVIVVKNRATNQTMDVAIQDVYLDENYTVADLLKDNYDNKLAIIKLEEKNIIYEQNFSNMKDIMSSMLNVMVSNGLDCSSFTNIIDNLKEETTNE